MIYFATLSGVDRSLLEAAEIDGASRLQKIWYVNLPVLMPTILILLVLNCGSLLSVGYEKVFLLQNPTNLSASEVISTFVYKSGLDDWTQLTLMVAGDELPDLLTGCYMNIGDVNEWGGEGYFLDLSQYLDEMPNLQAYFEKYPEMKAFCSTSDGHIYGLPRLRVDMTDRLTRSFVNKVWLENLGLEVPTTIDEYYDVLTAFKNQDANGNGDTNDEIPLLYTAASGGYSAIDTTFLDAFGIFTRDADCAFQADENGKVELANTGDKYKEFLKFMHKLYAEGLMEQEAFTITGEEVTTKEQEDVYGSLGCGSAPFVMAGKDISYDANWLGLSGLTSDVHSERETSIASPAQNGIMVAVNANTQYPEAMARFLDYFYTDEGMLSATKVPS
ncbi:MAG: extracellular solute-binding protein [Lachnospiraceae bacterium]